MHHFERQVALPWRDELAPEYRVWILHYEPGLDRRIRGRMGEFEAITRRHGKGWCALDLSGLVGRWFASHPLFEGLIEQPDELPGLLPEFASHVSETVRERLSALGADEVLALTGAGALFGLTRVSWLIEAVAPSIQGRLLVLFPGRYERGTYRLLDARDGWNYRATPIPP